MTRGRGGKDDPKGHAAYEGWVRDHAGELFRFGYRLCGDREVAEDLVQETFYEAWKCRKSLQHEDRARAWLFQILRHRYGRWRRTENRGPLQMPIDAVAREVPGADPARTPAEHDDLQKALGGLSDRLKLPLLMVLVQGMTCQEAADCLDLPLGTVLSRMHRAKKKLREALDDDEQSTSRDTQFPRFQIGGEP